MSRIRAICLVVSLGLVAGCGRTPAESARTGNSVPTPVLTADEVAPAAAPAPRQMTQPSTDPFRFPEDVGGKRVAQALAPNAPPAPTLPNAPGSRPRTSPLDEGSVPFPPVTAAMPRGPQTKAKAPRPTPPPESIPRDLSHLTTVEPASVGINEPKLIRSPLPPIPGAADLPPLARPAPDRVSTVDPTEAIAAARVVFTAIPVAALRPGFLRLGIPDPFELASHLRGKTGQASELGTSPANVPPALQK